MIYTKALYGLYIRIFRNCLGLDEGPENDRGVYIPDIEIIHNMTCDSVKIITFTLLKHGLE